MRKPGFGLVTLVVTLIALLGTAIKGLTPLLPKNLPNKMQNESADFLRQATYERVDWRPLSEEVFAEARRKDRPIFMLIGTPWSQMGRLADRTVFTDSEVQTFLNRNFICVRVDGVDHPEWLSCFRPISRQGLNFFNAFQIWLLDSKGRHYDYLSPISAVPFNAQTLLDRLIGSRDRLTELHKLNSTLPQPGSAQARDVANLLEGGSAYPDRVDFLAGVQERLDTKNGGFPDQGYQHPSPLTGITLLRLGDSDLFQRAWNPTMKSGIVDWLDGGFFRCSALPDWTRIQYDKVAVQNGYLMQMCLEAFAKTKAKCFDVVARTTFDCLVSSFFPNGYVAPCMVGDDGFLFRSRRSSFSVRVLRDLVAHDILGPGELDFLRDQMGLRVETNPQMSVRLGDLNTLSSDLERFQAVLAKLRKYRESVVRTPSGGVYLDVNASVCARLTMAARLWSDPAKLAIATALFDRLASFRSGDDVRHSLFPERNVSPTLLDYLNYADAALQDYLATGRSASILDGLQVLDRARTRFASETPGVWYFNPEVASPSWPENVRTPVIIDGEGESSTALTIRLLHAYGRLLAGGSPEVSHERAAAMVQEAVQGVTHFSMVGPKLGVDAAGYMSASLGVMDDVHVIAVGPTAQTMADQFAALHPAMLVAAAYGVVRPDLQKRKPGLYVVRFGEASGPFSSADASKLVSGVGGR